MLGEDDHQNPRDVAKKADSLWALHKMNLVPGATVASMEGSSSVDGLFSTPSVASPASSAVAAVSSRGASRGGRGSGRGGRGGRPSGVSRGGAQPPAGGQQAGGLPQASPLFALRTWLGFSMACASITSTSVSRPTTVLPPATGETSFPGASWRRSSRPAGPYYGPVITKAFPG
jgi:hypothetical protein